MEHDLVAAMTDSIMLGLVDGHIPFVVTRVAIATMRCRIPVVPGGDGATTVPLDERTAKCPHMTSFLVGAAPTCSHHLRDAFTIARGSDPMPAWWAVDPDRLPWSIEPCEVPA